MFLKRENILLDTVLLFTNEHIDFPWADNAGSLMAVCDPFFTFIVLFVQENNPIHDGLSSGQSALVLPLRWCDLSFLM